MSCNLLLTVVSRRGGRALTRLLSWDPLTAVMSAMPIVELWASFERAVGRNMPLGRSVWLAPEAIVVMTIAVSCEWPNVVDRTMMMGCCPVGVSLIIGFRLI